MGHKKGVLGGTIGLFVVALGCFFTLGRSFLPPFNEGSFTINISSLPGISLEESDKMGHRAEELLLSIPEIQTVARKTGRAELDEHALGVNVSEIEAPFELKDRSRSELVAEVREKLGTIVGANVEIGQPISHRIDAMLSGTKANIAIKLFGDDLNRMFTLGNEIKSAIQGIPGIADLNVEQQIERPQLVISPKREMLAKYGISLPEFSEFVNVCLAGEAVSQVYEKGKSFDLTVRVKDNLRDEMEKIRNLMIDTGDGQKIPLNYVAEIRSAMGPNTISRENVKRKIVISANVADRDLRSVVNDIQAQVDAQIKLPEGYHIEYGGQFESEQAASRTLALTSFMSIVVIFLLLYHEFRNVKESAIILINLPLALIGGVFALLITTGEVSIPHHRFHLTVRYRHPKRNAAHQPLQPLAAGRRLWRLRQRYPRFARPSESNPDDRPIQCTGTYPAGSQWRPAGQRDTKPDGKGYLGRPFNIHVPERFHHSDCLPDDAP